MRQGARALSEAIGTAACRIVPFMGRTRPAGGVPGFVKLAVADSDEALAEQWASLRARFSQPQTVLIYHLTNHYALIFALREWHEPIAPAEGTEREPPPPLMTAGVEASGAAATCRPAIECGGYRVVREILTARKGQRPSAWITFEEARNTMLRWSGYRILAVERIA